MNVTLEQLSDWVIANRKGRSFLNHSKQDVAYTLWEHARDNGMLFATNDLEQKIVGVVCFHQIQDEKTLFIDDVLTVDKDTTKLFIKRFKERFPDYALEGTRRNGFLKHYNTPRLTHLIERL